MSEWQEFTGLNRGDVLELYEKFRQDSSSGGAETRALFERWSPRCTGAGNMLDAIDAFRRIYCSTTGYDFAHVFVPEERQWLRHAVEGGRFRAPADPIDPVALLGQM